MSYVYDKDGRLMVDIADLPRRELKVTVRERDLEAMQDERLIAELREVCAKLMDVIEDMRRITHLFSHENRLLMRASELIVRSAPPVEKTGSIGEALRKSHDAGACAWDGVENPADLLGRDGVSEQEPEVKHG